MFLLVIITSAREKVKNDNNDNNDPIYETILKHFSPITTFLTCSIPMIIGIIRNCRGFTRIKKVKEIQRTLSKKFNSKNKNLKMKRTFRKSINEPLNLDESFDDNDQFDWLEKHAMQFFMRDIFLGIAHCIYKSKSYGTNIYLEDSKIEEYSVPKPKVPEQAITGFLNFTPAISTDKSASHSNASRLG